MRKAIISALAAFGLILALPVSAQQQTVVSFATGASSAKLKGSLKGDQDHSYVVQAGAGQTLTVDFEPTNASTYFNITAPGADSAMFIGSTSGNRFSGPLSVSGPHVVQVYLMRSAARRNETTNYTITIEATGTAAASPRPSRDALVAGTNYNATAEIPCITFEGAAKGRCKAGVVQWDILQVRLIDPRTGELLREHVRQSRGKRRMQEEDRPKRTPSTTLQLLSRAQRAGPHVGVVCETIHREDGEPGVRRILGLLSLCKRHGTARVDDACAAAVSLALPNYRFVKRYVERRPELSLTLKQVDPLIRELTHYRDLIDRRTEETVHEPG